MRILLVNPEAPESYWSGSRALKFARRKCLLPPLGLITVAAMLPQDWEFRLIDLYVEPLADDDILWADAVMLTGMIVQRTSLLQILDRCRELGVPTVVGGPYATSSPHELARADHLVLGEGEEIVPRFGADLAAGCTRRVYKEEGKPDVTKTPVPRYDLLKRDVYHHMAVQYSRGCPFTCEFCDIIVMYGRTPRTKTATQIIAELEAIRATDFAGDVFFVDDNFIGNKREVRKILPEIAAWRRRTAVPFEFYTEASINLADDMELVDQMVEAGFSAVFVGIETPSEEGLRETKKLQNLKRNMVDQIHDIMKKGMDVWAGFILGFDSDGPEIFERMIKFVNDAAIPYAMVGILGALPNTPLHKRLEKEGRLRDNLEGHQFGLTNVITKIPVQQMIDGYKHVLQHLYHPEAFFARCRANLARWKPTPEISRPVALRDVRAALRAIRGQGFSSSYRRAYWSFLKWVVQHHPSKLRRALAQAAAGHHYIVYTRDVVVPLLRSQALEVAEIPLLATAVPEVVEARAG